MNDSKAADRCFAFLKMNRPEAKPRTRGVTEIRGPYYTPVGRRYLDDLFQTMSDYIDALKFAGGSFTLMPRSAVREIIELCHRHDVVVSTGGFIEYVLTQGRDRALCRCRAADTLRLARRRTHRPNNTFGPSLLSHR